MKMKRMYAILIALLTAAVAAQATEQAEPFQITNFSAHVSSNNSTVYTFNLAYEEGMNTAHCNATSGASGVNCLGNLCVSYGKCDDGDVVLFNIGPDDYGTGLVVSIQSSYPWHAKLCNSCAKSGLAKLQNTIAWDGDVQVYKGSSNFSVNAVLTVYDDDD